MVSLPLTNNVYTNTLSGIVGILMLILVVGWEHTRLGENG